MTRTVSLLVLTSTLVLACGGDDGQAGTDDVGESSTGDTSGSDSDDASSTESSDDSTDAGDGDGDATTTDTDSSSDSSSDDNEDETTESTTGDGDADTDATSDDTTDESTSDESTSDESTTDESTTDTETTDDESTTGDPLTYDACGFPNDGPWVEMEYWQLGSVSSPSWTFSDTPGWGEAQWAYQGESWPEVWEFGGNSMTNDPIGIVASISGTWQMMTGLEDLIDYDYASVCVEGRSISVGSSAIFDVYNPFNGCGVEAQISNSWQVHAVGVDLGDCMIPGNDTQAVRIEPTGGSGVIGLKRVRVTLHGAVY